MARLETILENSKQESYAMPQVTGVSIIIPVLNGDFLRDTFSSIFRSSKNFELILIDNGSNQETKKYLKELEAYDKVTVIANEKNLGFAKANNQGALLAKNNLLLFLNSDVLCFAGWLEQMISKINYYDLDACAAAGGVYNKEFMGVGEVTSGKFDYLAGWCIMIKREVFEAIGGFDERYGYAFCEDTDLTFKLRSKGYNIGICETTVQHLGSKTVYNQNDFTVTEQSKNSLKLFRDKWFSKNIYLRRNSARGDVLMMTPIIREIKKKNPDRILNFITIPECKEVIEGNPHIDNLIADSYFDNETAYVLNYERNPEENRLDTIAKQFNITIQDKSLEITISKKVKKEVNAILKTIKKPFVVFHTGHSWQNREWNLNHFKLLGEWLQEKGYEIIEVGNDQTAYLGFNNMSDFLTMKETAEIIRQAEFFVGIDSLCLHLASAVKARSFIIYGVIEPRIVKTNEKETSFFVSGLSCRGCRISGHMIQNCKHNLHCVQIPLKTVKDEIENYLETGEQKDHVRV